jgi:DNA-3-methyladenine glycosylase
MIDPAWLGRRSELVAPDLLGCTLVRKIDGVEYRGLIVETEAYDATDPACHGYTRKTERNAAIFGAPGSVYVYLIYGVYHCINIVTDAENFCSAVLLRALELDRIPTWTNPQEKSTRVAAGPGKLCRALKIDRNLDGAILSPDSKLWLEPKSADYKFDTIQTTRIGLTKGADIPWRWYIKGHPSVSKK